jgi:hypothetical protein
MDRKSICPHVHTTKIENPQFPRIQVIVCDDCLQMNQVVVDGNTVWRTHR